MNVYYCCLVARLCPTLCDPMDCRAPDFPVLHQWVCITVAIKIFRTEEDKVTIKGKQGQRAGLTPDCKRKYSEGISLLLGWVLAQTHLHDPGTSARLQGIPIYQFTIGAGGVSVNVVRSVAWTCRCLGGNGLAGAGCAQVCVPVVLFFSSPVHRRGVEPLERLCGPVSAHGARAEARGAAGASERRRALPGPGGESRLPGVRDAAGPGLRARLRYCALLLCWPWVVSDRSGHCKERGGPGCAEERGGWGSVKQRLYPSAALKPCPTPSPAHLRLAGGPLPRCSSQL